MFSYRRTIHLEDTDATGFVYFAKIPSLVAEAFQHFLLKKNIPLQKFLQQKICNLPIVHITFDYYQRVQYASDMIIHLTLKK